MAEEFNDRRQGQKAVPLHIRILAGLLDRTAGSHVYHRELIRRLAARGHEVSVVCFRSTSEVEHVARVLEVPQVAYHEKPLMWRLAPILRYRDCTIAIRRGNLSKPDITIGGEHLFLKGHFGLFQETPWIYLPHSLVVSEEIKHYRLPRLLNFVTERLYKHLQIWALKRSSCILRFTWSGARFMDHFYHGRRKSAFYINPVGVTIPPPIMNGPIRTPRLLAVGQLIYRKGFDIALAALARLRHLPWKLDVIGEGNMRSELEQQAVTSGIGNKVFFRGHQNDPSEWYRRADLLLFPSRSESLGLVALEAMSHGVPCLAFRSDGVIFTNVNEEFIVNYQNGVVVRNEEEYSEELRRILANPSCLNALGQNARRTVEDHYSWDAHLARYEQLFGQLLIR